MKSRKIVAVFFMFVLVALLVGCRNAASSPPVSPTANTIIEMELTAHYDNASPFINEQLFCVTDTLDTLDLDISFQMQGETGAIEIADNESKEILWSNVWHGNVDNTEFVVTLDSLDKEKEYVVRLIGTEVEYAKVVVSTTNNLVQQRERPLAKQ